MFLGPGVQGNRVIGATDEGQYAIPINPQTLAFEKEAEYRVRPEHIHLALRELAGIQDHPMSERFPFEVKEAEMLQGLWGSAVPGPVNG